MTVEGGGDAAMTPAELAAELGIDPKDLRVFLRKRFPRSEAEHGDRWALGPVHRDAARRAFASSVPGTGAKTSGIKTVTIDEDGPFARANRIDQAAEDGTWRVLHGGLLGEPSVLTGRASVWTQANAAEVHARIIGNPLAGSNMSFDEKLRVQLADAEPDVVQLVAEFRIVHQVLTGGVRLAGALAALKVASGISGEEWTLPTWLQGAVAHDVFGGGNRFNQDQWLHIGLLAELVVAWHGLDASAQQDVLASPWTLLDFLETIGGGESGEKHMRMVVAYAAWPNYFHPIISASHIARIRAAFPEIVGAGSGHRNADVQRDLYVIDRALEAKNGGPVNFYRPPYEDYWRAPEPPVTPEPHPSPAVPSTDFGGVAAELAPYLFMERGSLERIARVLQERRQVVFYGPPGTGKTFVARKLADALAGEDAADAVRLVQFHPSYSYEDFFEGYRPTPKDGGPAFTLQPGPLRTLAKSALDNPDQSHFLIIDEMNRGNLAKVFGELYFLLEYRDQEVRLQYSPDAPFKLPDNLFIIGTMNTTDRSIGLIDAAIRRRFAFIEFHPEVSPVEGVLERYLREGGHPTELADLLGALNSQIGERDLRIGPSYLMRPTALQPGGLQDIWDFDILPLLHEHFHGRKSVDEVRQQFSLNALRGASAGETM